MSNNGKVCIKCQVELRPKQNGVGAVEMADFGASALYDADLWACPVCGLEVLIGFGREPIAEHFQPDFQQRVDGYAPHVVRFWQNAAAKGRNLGHAAPALLLRLTAAITATAAAVLAWDALVGAWLR